MGRGKGLLSTLIKISNDMQRAENRRQREEQKHIKKQEREYIQFEKIEERKTRIIDKEREKAIAQQEKEIKTNLTVQTIKKYSLGKIKETNISINNIPPIDLPLEIVSESQSNDYFQIQKKIESSAIDNFLFSGRYNSVLGPDGFRNFKNNLRTLVGDANKGISKDNLINLDDFFEVLLRSGIYYENDQLPNDLKQDDMGLLTAYRFISKRLPAVTYKEYRQIVKCLEKTGGRTLEFDQNEINGEIYKKIVSSGLFIESSSAEHILATISMSELRSLCAEFQLSAKRSKEETIKQIACIESIDLIINQKYPGKGAGLVFKLKDIDLVKGIDIINLDKYLRNISKHIRNDLSQFIESKRTNKFITRG